MASFRRPVPQCVGVYRPHRAAASPLFRLLQDHFPAFHSCYEERFAATYGDWRPVVREVAEKFLTCGILAHGFARVRCERAGCGHEYLLAFSCKARYFCPSCHARRLALWTLWLEETLLARAVPHRQVVLTIPKRLRTWCLYRRRLLGEVARAAARTVTAAVRALTDEQIAAMRDPALAGTVKLPTIEDAVKAGGFLAGTPADIIEQLKAIEKRYPGLDRVICATPLGTPIDVQLEDLDRFAKEVMPAFRPSAMAAAAK